MSKIEFHVHLVSDATGETVASVARACEVQFDTIKAIEHCWPMIRSQGQMEHALKGIAANPGIVLCTLVDDELRLMLADGCRKLKIPCIPILDPVIAAFGAYLGIEAKGLPGRQHMMDAEYFNRIDAMHYVLSHDDGQSVWNLEDADVVLVGVSRTSKTPTCVYLANRGVRAANIPIVPGCPLPPELDSLKKPLVVGLTKDPRHLVQIRRNRLKLLNRPETSDYVDPDFVSQEIAFARRLFAKYDWPVIDVTRKSIEETATAILQMYQKRQEIAAEDAQK